MTSFFPRLFLSYFFLLFASLLAAVLLPAAARAQLCCYSAASDTCAVKEGNQPCAPAAAESSSEENPLDLAPIGQTRTGGQAPSLEDLRSDVREVACRSFPTCAEQVLNTTANCPRASTPESCEGATARSAGCFWYNDYCYGKFDDRGCYNIRDESYCGAKKGNEVCVWKAETGKCLNKIQAGAVAGAGIDYSQEGAFPKCGFDGTCDSLNDFLRQQVGWANYAFGFVGVIGFISFVVGGIQMITSFGNPEKFKKGMQLMVGAIIGLTIVFSAYLIVKFVLDALGVTSEFRGV